MIATILYESEDFMAVDKPAGVLSQKDKSGDSDLAELLKRELAKAGRDFPFLAPAHRLDRNTSGVILLAKSARGARLFADWLQAGKVQKTYLAIVKGDPGEKGRYDFALEKDRAANQVYVSEEGRDAVTLFRRKQKLGNSCLVEIELVTGRSHQIRAHFAAGGHALLGDRKYAKKPWSEIYTRPALHAWRLQLPPESGVKKAIEAAVPPDFAALLSRLGGKL